MDIRKLLKNLGLLIAPLAFLATAPLAIGQVPVDEDGSPVGDWEDAGQEAYQEPYSNEEYGNEGIPLLSEAELEDLVGPVALYPDDLLAVVLPASTYPLQVVQAARFLEELETNPDAKPDPEWDDSIIALVNYPEVVELLNEDLDWTWRLGEAVVAQQADVVMAVEGFRDRAYAAGNLKSDEYQHVSHDDGVIEITPAREDVIYVPYYEPERVVVYQPRPVYYYYPRPSPVYYYPYPDTYAFRRGYFWGVTTAFAIGWRYDHLRVFHHSYHGHPYYGRKYRNRWWYRRPSINVYNRSYARNTRNVTVNRYTYGDTWRPSQRTRVRYSSQRVIDREANYDRYRNRTQDGNRNRHNNRDLDRRTSNRSGSVGTVPPDYKSSSRYDREPNRTRLTNNRNSTRNYDRSTARSQPRTTNRSQAQTRNRSDSRPERRTDSRPERRTESRPERRTERRTDARPERRTESRPERRTDSRPERRIETRQQNSGERRSQRSEPRESKSQKSESRRSESRGSRRDEPRQRPR